MNFHATLRGHTLYYEIVTGTRAIAAERDGFTKRPWRGGRQGACGIRRFNHPPCPPPRRGEGGGGSEMRDAVLLTDARATPTQRGGRSAPSENRTSARADAGSAGASRLPLTHAFPTFQWGHQILYFNKNSLYNMQQWFKSVCSTYCIYQILNIPLELTILGFSCNLTIQIFVMAILNKEYFDFHLMCIS